MGRLAALILALLFSACLAEEAPALSACTTVEQVLSLMDFPTVDEAGTVQPVGVRAGALRYISQEDGTDPLFCAAYWQGGKPGDELDLTLEEDAKHEPYAYSARTMCTRAVYSMILSYFGLDMTPGAMSALTGQRHLSEPYDEITALLPGLERGDTATRLFDTMWEHYLSAPQIYSPVYLYIRKPNGKTHALLVVSATGNPSEYIVVDSAYHELDGVSAPVYTIVLNKNRSEILHAAFYRELAGSRVKWSYQWEKASE